MLEIYKNSYVTLEEADEYFSEKLDADFWKGLDDSKKEKALITASRRIDMQPFLGRKAHPEQAMSFPRIIRGKKYEILYRIKAAVCEQVFEMFSNNFTANSNVKSVSLGSASITFSDSADFELCSESKLLLSGLLKTGSDIENSYYEEKY